MTESNAQVLCIMPLRTIQNVASEKMSRKRKNLLRFCSFYRRCGVAPVGIRRDLCRRVAGHQSGGVYEQLEISTRHDGALQSQYLGRDAVDSALGPRPGSRLGGKQ